MIYYFSGTGNSLWTAKRLGELLDEPVEGLVKYRKEPLSCKDPVVGFVCPLYMWDLPAVVRSVLEKAVLGESSYIFLVLTSNNGDKNLGDRCPAYKSMEGLVERAGGRLSAVFMLQMPGNALESSAQENRQRLEAAPDRVKRFSQQIAGRVCSYVPRPDGFLGRMMAKRTKNGEKGGSSAMRRFTVLDDCTGCGACARACPRDNIRLVDGKAVHGTECAGCLACFHWCPKRATASELSLLKKRAQYTHPEVTVEDMAREKE